LVVVYKKENGQFAVSVGTAFVVNKSGTLATARHMFLGKRILTVYLLIPDGDKFFIRSPYFVRLHKITDVAIFKVRYRFKTQVKITRSDELKSSDLIYYIGYPVISNNLLVPQKVSIDRFFGYTKMSNKYRYIKYVSQMSRVAAMGGASGSPLFNHYGRLVGIIVFTSTPHKHSPNFTGSVPIRYLFELLSKKSSLYVDINIKSHK